MKRIVWRLLVACPALLGLAAVGCYQGSTSKGATGTAPVNSATRAAVPVDQAATNADDAAPSADAVAVSKLDLPEGTMAILLAVPGMH